jgi:hypothetical protein
MDAKIETVTAALDSFDLTCQTRARIDGEAVAEYAERIKNGESLGPALAFRAEDGRLLLSCGFHRRLAYRQAGRDVMPVEILKSNRVMAIKAGVDDNRKHLGVRLTLADRRKAAEMFLRVRPDLADRMVAKLAGLSDKTVSKTRAELEATAEIPRLRSRVGHDGRGRIVPHLDSTSTSQPSPKRSCEVLDGPPVVEQRVEERPTDSSRTPRLCSRMRAGWERVEGRDEGRGELVLLLVRLLRSRRRLGPAATPPRFPDASKGKTRGAKGAKRGRVSGEPVR